MSCLGKEKFHAVYRLPCETIGSGYEPGLLWDLSAEGMCHVPYGTCTLLSIVSRGTAWLCLQHTLSLNVPRD